MNSKEWTWEDYEFLYRNYNLVHVKDIAAKLQRSVGSVVAHAEKLGLLPKVSTSQEDKNLVVEHKKKLGTALVFLLPEYSTTMMEDLIACTK